MVEVTVLLKAWNDGDPEALNRLAPIVYHELRRLAYRSMRAEREGHLLQPSVLVHEAFLRLMGGEPPAWENRAHFFAFSARLMRQILIDFSRIQDAKKRGSRRAHLDLTAVMDQAGVAPQPVDFLDLDAALKTLQTLHERQARVVELRYFGGLENLEIAEVLGVSEPTVIRDWRAARAWLFSRLRKGQSPEPMDPSHG